MPHLKNSGSMRNDEPAARHACVVVFLLGRSTVERFGQVLIENADNRKFVSIITCWEIAIKSK